MLKSKRILACILVTSFVLMVLLVGDAGIQAFIQYYFHYPSQLLDVVFNCIAYLPSYFLGALAIVLSFYPFFLILNSATRRWSILLMVSGITGCSWIVMYHLLCGIANGLTFVDTVCRRQYWEYPLLKQYLAFFLYGDLTGLVAIAVVRIRGLSMKNAERYRKCKGIRFFLLFLLFINGFLSYLASIQVRLNPGWGGNSWGKTCMVLGLIVPASIGLVFMVYGLQLDNTKEITHFPHTLLQRSLIIVLCAIFSYIGFIFYTQILSICHDQAELDIMGRSFLELSVPIVVGLLYIFANGHE